MDNIIPTKLEAYTEQELIEELSGRNSRLIVIRPDIKDEASVKIFCNTNGTNPPPFDLFVALNMLHDAQTGMIKNCVR